MPACFRSARSGWLSLCFAFGLFGVRPAFADWQCPVGVDPTGANNTGIACVWIDDSGGEEDSGYGGASPPSMHHYSPEEWQAFIYAGLKADSDAEAKRMRDPAYRALKAGVWDFSESPKGKGPHFCAASFLTLKGGVLLMNVTGKDGGTFLGYFGGRIPPGTRKPEKVLLNLVQSGETQTVHALHARFPLARALGMYLFVVPGTQALLGSIEDTQDYAVSQDGELKVQGAWRDGLKARDWLRDCIAR